MIGPGSEYLVWLVITQWIGSPFVHKGVIWFGFLITYLSDPLGTDLSFVFFQRYLEKSGGVLVNLINIYLQILRRQCCLRQ